MAWKNSGQPVAIERAVEGVDYPREWNGAITCPICTGRGGECCDDGSGVGVGLAPAWMVDPEVVGYPHEVAADEEARHGAEDENDEVIKLTADVVLFGDFLGEGRFVLLIERGWEPFKGYYALPGGHADLGEDTEDAAYRELTEETGLRIGPQLKAVGAYQTPKRDPRGRYVTFAYAGRMPHRVEPSAGDDATRAAWVPLDEVLSGVVPVAFDHARIIRDALNVVPFYHS